MMRRFAELGGKGGNRRRTRRSDSADNYAGRLSDHGPIELVVRRTSADRNILESD